MNDAKLVFSDGQAVTATAISSNTIDLDQVRDVGASDLFLHLVVDTSFSSDTETVAVDLVAATATCTAGSTVVQSILAATAASALTKGVKRVVSIARDVMTANSYTNLGVLYTAPSAVATGKFNCWISMNKGD
jgi:hypothetical protein